jgi:hypothetical protein
MRNLSAIAFLLTLLAPLPAIAQTQADAAACTPDAMRLCQQAIPDHGRVVLCLVQNKRQLSPACSMVFNHPSTANVSGTRQANISNKRQGRVSRKRQASIQKATLQAN